MFTDNRDFYPTPESLFHKLMNGTRVLLGRILEPSAGKGDMINHINRKVGRYKEDVKIDAIEIDENLSNILLANGHTVVWGDFLTYQTYKEYDHIIMNPPFSRGVDHALKAIELAENQLSDCELYIILNRETIDNAYTDKRKDLLQKLDKHDADVRYVKDSFVTAERRTNVEVALVNVHVKKNRRGKSVYEKIPFHTLQDDVEVELGTALSTYVADNEVRHKMNDIERLVLEYETACEVSRNAYEASSKKEQFMSYIDTVNKGADMRSGKLHIITTNKFTARDLNEELNRLRRGYWQLILDTDDFRKMLTNDAIQKLNRQMNVANEMEINLTNIKMLITALSANQDDILMDSIISIFKKITKYHMNQYSTNIHYYNGWKTNDAYKVNHKIIIPIKSEFEPLFDFNKDYENINMNVRFYINDIVKAFQLIDPTINKEFRALSNQEFESDLLRFKMFLNGNIHIWFKDLALLNKLNYLCGSHFNWIPSEEEQKANEKARRFVEKEFGELRVENILDSAVT